MQLRPYQIEAVNQLSAGFKHHKRQILCLPTGGGKTVTFSEIVRRASVKKTQCLVLTDRLELFEQTYNALDGHLKIDDLQEINAETKMQDFNPHALVTVGMVETVKRRFLPGYEPGLIIIDEAHKGNFTALLDKYHDAYVIGATATPLGKHLFEYYGQIVQNVDIPELIELGFLCPVKGYQMVTDMSDLEVRGSEYTEQSQFKHFDKGKLYEGVVEQWLDKTPGQKTIVFNVNIEHAEKMTEEFNAAGIVSKCVTSETDKAEREEILAEFKRGDFLVLNNCGILTTGYDEPSITCVVMNRATMSLALWLQCCGRGSRPFPGKDRFTVLDFGMNHHRLGRWDEPRQWKLKAPKKGALKASPTKTCPNCDAMLFLLAPMCEYCGYRYPIIEKDGEQELHTGIMVEVQSTVPPELAGRKISEVELTGLATLQKIKRYSSAFIWRIVRAKGEDAIGEYAKLLGYKDGWVKRQSQEAEDPEKCKFSDFTLR